MFLSLFLSLPFFDDRPRPLHCCFVIRLNFLDEMIGSIDRSLALIQAEFEVHLRFGEFRGSQILKVMFGVKYGELVNMCKASWVSSGPYFVVGPPSGWPPSFHFHRQTPSLKLLIDVVQSVSVSFLGDVNVMARRTPLFVHQVKTS